MHLGQSPKWPNWVITHYSVVTHLLGTLVEIVFLISVDEVTVSQ
jgi:hypothetical protein